MFKRTRYQQGSISLEQRKRGAAVWVYRWWEKDIDGKSIRRKLQVGDSTEHRTKSAAKAAADALRLTINNHSQRTRLQRTTVCMLWEHYKSEELLLKERLHARARWVEAIQKSLPKSSRSFSA